MSIIKSFSVSNGDMFYIEHNSDNFTVIDCNLQEDSKEALMDQICNIGKNKGIKRFISTHPDEDHFHGIEYFDKRFSIINFYCVKNDATKQEETISFKKYCELRDDEKKSFYIKKGCNRKWMNQSDEERGSSGINVLWPDTDNDKFQEQLSIANNGGNTNNISPIIKYELEDGVSVLWFGDMETEYMEDILEEITFPKIDIIFAPHHGRSSGKIPSKWLKQISPQIIVIGEADSKMLDYYKEYNTITQNTAKDIVFECLTKKVHVYVSNEKYSVDYLKDEKKDDRQNEYYIGSFETYE